jgi:hypothetical protein
MNDAWLAGIIEGEGHFGRMTRKYESKKNGLVVYSYPFCAVTSTDLDVIESVKKVAGCGYIRKRKWKAQEHHKDQWHWTCAAREDFINLLERIYPYMHSRRKAKIDSLNVNFGAKNFEFLADSEKAS